MNIFKKFYYTYSKEATTWWFSLLLFSLLPTVFTVLVWGPVTDIIGRRRYILKKSLFHFRNSFLIFRPIHDILSGRVILWGMES